MQRFTNGSTSEKENLKGNDTLKITVTITNTGKMAGKEVAQLYIKDHFASITPPVKKLKRFEKISLAPGESKKVSFKISKTDLSFVNNQLAWVAEPGTFHVTVGSQNKKITYLDK